MEEIEATTHSYRGEWIPPVPSSGVPVSRRHRLPLGLASKPGAAGRIPVNADLTVPGRPGIYALGDTALTLGADKKPLPALAQVAKQQGAIWGRHCARNSCLGEPWAVRLSQPWKYRSHRPQRRNIRFRQMAFEGAPAWFLWAIVHVWLLVNFEKRLLVSIQWVWRYATRQRGARLIDEDAADRLRSVP